MYQCVRDFCVAPSDPIESAVTRYQEVPPRVVGAMYNLRYTVRYETDSGVLRALRVEMHATRIYKIPPKTTGVVTVIIIFFFLGHLSTWL